jgi:hypothetical protein
LFSTGSSFSQGVSLPPPDAGSFVTAFDFLPDGRVVAYPGSTVLVQEAVGSPTFELLGTLPPEFQGGSDAAFIHTAPAALFFILGTGAGGAQFGDPQFNGNVFRLDGDGGVAELVAKVPFHAFATFGIPIEMFLSRGDETFTSARVVHLALLTGEVRTVIENIPGASGGVGRDVTGDLFVGLGFDFTGVRTGEIRRFDRTAVLEALLTGVPLDFTADGEFVAQVLSAGALLFDLEGDLWVSGGDLFGPGEEGFIAEVDPETGTVLRRIDPSDGDPDSGPLVFFNIAISDPISCTIGAVDEFDPDRTVHFIDACQTLPLP